MFTRNGGTSVPPYHSLNASYSTGDDPEKVNRNLHIIRSALGTETLLYTKQVHGNEVHRVPRDGPLTRHQGITADGMITDRPGVALMVKQADCQGVILYDPGKGVLALVHCGWRGNTLDILGTAVARMTSDFGCEPARIRAAVGPSLGPCCAEFKTHEEIFPAPFRRFMVRNDHFDLWAISHRQLTQAGLRDTHIETAGICTRCRTDLFFSYRAEGVTGRFATAAMLLP